MIKIQIKTKKTASPSKKIGTKKAISPQKSVGKKILPVSKKVVSSAKKSSHKTVSKIKTVPKKAVPVKKAVVSKVVEKKTKKPVVSKTTKNVKKEASQKTPVVVKSLSKAKKIKPIVVRTVSKKVSPQKQTEASLVKTSTPTASKEVKTTSVSAPIPVKKEVYKIAPSLSDHVKAFFRKIGFSQKIDADKLAYAIKIGKDGCFVLEQNFQDMPVLRKKNVSVFSVSLGGSHIKRALITVSPQNETRIESFDEEKITLPFRMHSAHEFWGKLFPPRALQKIKQSEHPVLVSFSIACPLKKVGAQTFLLHGAGKFKTPFGPFEAGKEEGKKDLTEALRFFLDDKQLSHIPVFISPSDTFSAFHAFSHEKRGKELAIFICGTGVSAGTRQHHFEIGRFSQIPLSSVEKKFFKRAKIQPQLENILSGRFLPDIFLEMLASFLGSKSPLLLVFERMKREQLVEFFWHAAFEKKVQFPASVSKDQELQILKCVREISDRLVHNCAVTLLALEKVVRKPLVFFAEGSVLTQQPFLVAAINDKVRSLTHNSQRTDILEVVKLPVKRSEYKDFLDATLVGGAIAGAEYTVFN